MYMLNFKSLLFLTATCFFIHHGVTSIFYFLVAIICFLVSFFVFHDKPSIHFQRRGCISSRGISQVLDIMNTEGVLQPDRSLTNSEELDNIINQILCYILRDYITSWYASLTSDCIFPTELHKLLLRITKNIIQRISGVNWIPFLTESLPAYLASHVRLHRLMCERLSANPDKNPLKLFFDVEAETEKNICHEDICSSREKEKDHLRRLSDMFLFFVVPNEEYRVPAVRYIARELLVNAIVIPTIDLISDPDFINRTVAWFAPDGSYTSEYYCHALRMSESIEELEVVTHQLNIFMSKLRGHDTGGDDDAFIKAQLGSLEYVLKICSIRSRQIKEGITEKPERLVDYHLQSNVRLYDMSFQELMSKSVAVVSFLDFLTSIEKHSLLRLYLNCVSFREGATQNSNNDSSVNHMIHSSVLALADASSMEETITTGCEPDLINYSMDSENVKLVEDEDDISCSNCDNEDTSVTLTDDISTTIPTKADDDLTKQGDYIGHLRGFGINICSNLLHQMPLSAEPLIQRALRALTCEPSYVNPDVFVDIEKQLIEMLSGPQCFGAFKRSSHYVHLLAELDLLKEPSDLTASSTVTSSNDSIPVSKISTAPVMSLSKQINVPSSSTTFISGPASDNSTDFNNNLIIPKVGLSEGENVINKADFCRNLDSQNDKSSTVPVSNVESNTSTYMASIVRTEIMHDSYAVYTLKVYNTTHATGHTESWYTLRRFRHFVELHSFITDRCGRIPELKLPSKITLNNMSADFLAQRRRGLNCYLATLCDPTFLINHPTSRPLIVQFLQPDSWERGRVQARIVSAILTPFRTMGNAVMSVPDTLADGLNKIFTGKAFPLPNNPENDNLNRKSTMFEMEETSNNSSQMFKSMDPVDISSNDETPIRMLFLLVDEIFDLHRENQFTRHGNFAILRKIFQTFFGIRVNKMIIAKATEWTSARKITRLIAYIRDYLWPSNPSASHLMERDKEMKLRTRVLCRTMLLGSISEELAQFLGNETTRRGVSRVFNLLQEESFNRRFVHLILEAFLCKLFRSYQAYWESAYESNLCPLKTGRQCNSHKTCP